MNLPEWTKFLADHRISDWDALPPVEQKALIPAWGEASRQLTAVPFDINSLDALDAWRGDDNRDLAFDLAREGAHGWAES